MHISLRYRLLFPLALLLFGDAVLTWWAASTAAAVTEKRISRQVEDVATTLTEPPTFPLSTRVLEQMRQLTGAEFALQKRNGEWIATLPSAMEVDLSPLPSADARVAVIGSGEFRVMRIPLRSPHPNAGDVLFVCYPEELRRNAVRDAVRPTLLLGGVGGIIAAVLTTLVSSRLVLRIRQLDQRTRAIAAGDFRPMPVPNAADELRDLADSVNDMAGKLAHYQLALTQTERLRVLGQFSGGLAHQLRNAAGGAKLAIQLYLADGQQGDREPLDVALRQLVRIEMNLRQFLDLGRPPPANMQQCNLIEILQQAIALFRPQCLHAGVTLTWQTTEKTIPLVADAASLGHLFVNLIDNAIAAAGPGGVVEVFAESAVVEVRDSGSGPPPEIADRLFDAFVTGKDQGVGLGLAVAKQAADAHGAELLWIRENGRTIFRVRFPSH